MATRILGPTGSKRRRRFLFVPALLVVATSLFLVASASGVLPGSPSNFEANDGNMIVDTSGNSDWANVSYFHLVDVASSQTDDSFVSGQKQDTACPDTAGHGNPPKDDFTDVASYTETNSNSSSAQYHHTFLYGATIRYTANGSASENVELKQGKNGTCTNGLLARTLADKLIAIDYHGSAATEFHVLTWITTSAGYDPTPNTDSTDDIAGTCFVSNDAPPCWSSTVKTLTANAAEGAVNPSAICVVKTNKSGLCPNGGDAANDPIGNAADSNDSTKFSVEKGQNLDLGQFAEFGVDLTAAGIIPSNTCTAFPQTIWESRSSGDSFVSTTKDISIENHSISNCGEIKIIKQTKPRGIAQRFGFTSNLLANANAGGVACSDTPGAPAGVDANGAFCLNDAGNSGKTLGSSAAAQNSAGNTVDENNLFPGTYTVTEGSDPSGFAFDSVTCKVNGTTTTLNTVGAPKTVTVNLGVNDVVVCIYQNNQQLGAIKITKTSSKAAATPLAGAHFELCTNAGPYNTGVNQDQNPCSVVSGASDLVSGDDGTVCKDGLGFNTYYVHEKTAPSGYGIDDGSGRSVVVSHNAKCSDATYVGESITFTDTPLTDIVAKATSEAAGGTASRVTCVDSSNLDVGNSPKPSASTFSDPAEVDANGLRPGTYTCTLIIDP